MAVRTKQYICEAFLELLEVMPLNRITVRDIVEHCGVNRNTFYYHFPDIPSLIEYIVEEKVDRLIADYPTVDSIDAAMQATLEFASRNQRVLQHIYNSASRDLFEMHLWRLCEYVVTTYGKVLFSDSRISDADREIILNAYTDECFGRVMGWLRRGMKADERETLQRFLALRQGTAETMLARAQE